MDREIDLQKILRSLIARWKLVVMTPLFLMIIVLITLLVSPPPYAASARIAVVKAKTQVGFGSNIKTITEDDLALIGLRSAGSDARIQSLVDLVHNGDIATAVIKQLEAKLKPEQRDPSAMLGKVKGELITGADLIAIQVTDKDPDFAAEVANAWAREYELYINHLYASNLPGFSQSVQDEYDRTRKSYDDAQLAVEEYTANNQVDEFSRQVSEKQQVMGALQEQSITAVKAVMNERLNRSANMVLQYLRGQNAATSTVISSRFDDQFQELAHYYSVKLGMRNLIEEAKALRDQINQGGASATSTNAYALLLFKAGLFNNGAPGSVQFNLGSLDSLAASTAAQTTDVDSVIAAMQTRLTTAEREIERLEKNLLSGEGFILPETVAKDTPIQQIANAQINRIFDLEGMSDLDKSFIDTPIAKRIKQFEDEIIQLRSKIEREQARGLDLTTKRDLAREAFTTLARKQQEVVISDQVQGGEVRFAASAYAPISRSVSRVLILVATGIAGLALGAVFVLIVSSLSVFMPLNRLFGPENAAHNRFFRWLIGEDVRVTKQLAPATDDAASA